MFLKRRREVLSFLILRCSGKYRKNFNDNLALSLNVFAGWGSEAKYKYPEKSGMVGLWRNLAKSLPKNNVRFKTEVSQLEIEAKKIVTKAGLEIT